MSIRCGDLFFFQIQIRLERRTQCSKSTFPSSTMSYVFGESLYSNPHCKADALHALSTATEVGDLGCMILAGGKLDEYPRFKSSDGKRAYPTAHKLLYIYGQGDTAVRVPDGFEVAHHCPNHGCVKHLIPRSKLHNDQDRVVYKFPDMPDVRQHLPDRDGIGNLSVPTDELVRNEITFLVETLEKAGRVLEGDGDNWTVVEDGEPLDEEDAEELLAEIREILEHPKVKAVVEKARAGGKFNLSRYLDVPDAAQLRRLDSRKRPAEE